MEEITGNDLPRDYTIARYHETKETEIQQIFVNGKLRPYCAGAQRQFNCNAILYRHGIISEKEFYIIKHRIIKQIGDRKVIADKIEKDSM